MDAAAPEQVSFGARLDDDVGDQPGEQNIVGSDGQQHEIETAVGAVATRHSQDVLQLGDLGAGGSRTCRPAARIWAFARPLTVEKADIDGGARAAERNESHGEVRILDCERQRRAHLIAVERAMAGPAHPARALPRPVGNSSIFPGHRVARPVAGEAGPPGPIIFDAVEALEAKAFIGQSHRTVRIAFTGGDRVPHSGDQHVAHLDLAYDPLGRAVRQDDVDAHHIRSAVRQPND